MSDEKRHPVVQSMIDTIDEVLNPEAVAQRRQQEHQDNPEPIEKTIELTPDMVILLKLLQAGIDPSALGIETGDDDNDDE